MPKPTNKQNKAFNRLLKRDPNAQVRWDEATGVPARVRGNFADPQTGDPEPIAMQFITSNRRLYRIKKTGKELQHVKTTVDRQGNKHVRYQQMYNNLPVFAREIIVHVSTENNITGVNGKFQPRIDLPEQPEVDPASAKKIALRDSEDNKERPDTDPLLLVFIHEEKPYLAWHLSVNGTDRGLDGSQIPAIWEYFVDALNGEIIWRYNNMQSHTKTTGTGTGKYVGGVSLNTFHDHDIMMYCLEDRWLPTGARIYTENGNSGVSVDSDNDWSATSQGPEVDCHYYTRMVYDYFLLMHGRDSFDDAGADMRIKAHYGTNENNAYWNGSLVLVGDGDGVTRDPYCALDVIAHEWTHAITAYTAGLTYYGETGALNESISDVFAALIDGDWLQGEDYWLPATAPASRNLADPTNGGLFDSTDHLASAIAGHQPDHMTDIYSGTDDYGGVHINSGIMNKAAFLIATGGTHRNITICEGLGREVLGRLYYQALTAYLTSSSDFADMREAVLDALDDLYFGDPRYDRWQASIINAFAAVGISTAVVCPLTCWISPADCQLSPIDMCWVGPIDFCSSQPQLICPPNPILCSKAPLICAPNPILICPSAPLIECPPMPGAGCLPGPDPLPFRPEIEELAEEL